MAKVSVAGHEASQMRQEVDKNANLAFGALVVFMLNLMSECRYVSVLDRFVD